MTGPLAARKILVLGSVFVLNSCLLLGNLARSKLVVTLLDLGVLWARTNLSGESAACVCVDKSTVNRTNTGKSPFSNWPRCY